MDERPVRTEVKPGELWAEGLIRACVRLALRKLKSGSWGRKGVEVRWQYSESLPLLES